MRQTQKAWFLPRLKIGARVGQREAPRRMVQVGDYAVKDNAVKRSWPRRVLAALGRFFADPELEWPALEAGEEVLLHGKGSRRHAYMGAPLQGRYILTSKRFLWDPYPQTGLMSPGPPMAVRLEDVEAVRTANLFNWVFGGRRLKLYLRDSSLVQLFISEGRPHKLDEVADGIRSLISK